MLNGGSGCRSSIVRFDFYPFNVFRHCVSKDVLGEHVRTSLRPLKFGQCEVTFSESVLYSQLCHLQVADSSKTSTTANADCLRGIGEDSQVRLDPGVVGQWLRAQTQ